MSHIPLPERMRPTTLDEVVGQAHLLGPRGALTRLTAGGRLPSMVHVGSARHRQDDPGPHPGGGHGPWLPGILRGRRQPPRNLRSSSQIAGSSPSSAQCLPSYSWTRSIASTGPSRISCCPSWSGAKPILVGATTGESGFLPEPGAAQPLPAHRPQGPRARPDPTGAPAGLGQGTRGRARTVGSFRVAVELGRRGPAFGPLGTGDLA